MNGYLRPPKSSTYLSLTANLGFENIECTQLIANQKIENFKIEKKHTSKPVSGGDGQFCQVTIIMLFIFQE
ncbi:hypothetical protein DERP_006354 [Dermatophagoides pteronyssinus]|uniref:Uncharacterized protein n=1 Tax=Dermatophagoides pteronyssinus TaxID=6956 RepID=A0ABQ8IYU2_DERPT|nr:hypothetical protein DERP_006354 [Dermatophagoides pteronyssinus]